MNINPAHWHLLLNHFPIILSIVGTGFIVAAFLFKKQHLRFGGLLMLIIAAAGAYLAFQTGEGAEDTVEKLAGVSHDAIENHEESANIGWKIMLGTGLLALITILLVHAKKKQANLFLIITLIASLASAGYMSYVGYTGGEIRHSEIRGDFGGSKTPATEPLNSGRESDEDDGDY